QALLACLQTQLILPTRRGPKNCVDQCPTAFRRELDRFVDRRVLGGFEEKELVKTEAKKMAKIDIEGRVAEGAEPKIKERCIAQDAVNSLQNKSAVARIDLRLSQQLADERIGDALVVWPRPRH